MIYLIASREQEALKIGTTGGNVERRLQQLQVGNPARLTLVHVGPGGLAEERHLHRVFRHLYIGGEWYELRDELSLYLALLGGRIAGSPRERERVMALVDADPADLDECPVCGRAFITDWRRRYCSRECSEALRWGDAPET